MGLLDGLMGAAGNSGTTQMLEGAAVSALAAKFGIDPAMAQGLAGTLLGNMQSGQAPTDAVAAAADQHGIDPATVAQFGEALAGHAGAEGGMGGLAGLLSGAAGGAGGAGGLAGMLGGLLGGAKS